MTAAHTRRRIAARFAATALWGGPSGRQSPEQRRPGRRCSSPRRYGHAESQLRSALAAPSRLGRRRCSAWVLGAAGEPLPELVEGFGDMLEGLPGDQLLVPDFGDAEDAFVDDAFTLAHAVAAESEREVALVQDRV